MEKGLLVPDEIVTKMVKDRLTQEDAQENGWLLDGYPRSLSQAKVLEEMQVQPDIFLLLEVPNEILVERVVGRRLDPVTGKIYHLKYSPPENKQIAERLTQRFDDTEDKAMSRLETYREYTEDILSVYNDRTQKIDGNRPKELVFEEIDKILNNLLEKDERLSNTRMSKEDQKISFKNKWEGIPTRLNNIPHSREIRQYFYEDVCAATIRAVEDGITRLKIDIGIPELNPNTDVFRIGTLMELVREIALHFAYDGRYVKVCVQNPMGEGALVGMPLQLAGTRRILEFMDWGEHGALGTFVKIGSIGAREVTDEDDMFILVAPQNAVGNCIIYDLQAMSDAAGSRPVLLVNPRLKDIPSAGGVMQTIGREKRMDFANSFLSCYLFRLLYQAGTQYPIMGAIRMCYPSDYELYKRVDTGPGKEKYIKTATFSNEPTPTQIEDAFSGRRRDKESKPGGLWGLLRSIL
eukprot:TRINITY_DN1125_c0_g1_i2.p1 TRINITY_DN1125_c0_g1~~TRINITY_DN1125_c0_g1_i2.p1  ORF type:complete len:464 (-),score=107.75 TRINITY_DN1125_c0_g1_i2:334-1725(-)